MKKAFQFFCFCMGLFFSLHVYSSPSFIEEMNVQRGLEERLRLFNLLFPEEALSEDEILSIKGLDQLERKEIPHHVSINLQGLPSFLLNREVPFLDRYKECIEKIISMIKFQALLGIKVVSYSSMSLGDISFKTPEDIDDFLGLFSTFLEEENIGIRSFVRVRFVGDLGSLPSEIYDKLIQINNQTKSNSLFTVCFGVNWNGRQEMSRAVANIANDFKNGILGKEEISASLIQRYMNLGDIPDADLFIQTAGDASLHPIWGLNEAECVFVPKQWSDFSKQDFVNVLLEFKKKLIS